jgi:hypothetical protein
MPPGLPRGLLRELHAQCLVDSLGGPEYGGDIGREDHDVRALGKMRSVLPANASGEIIFGAHTVWAPPILPSRWHTSSARAWLQV